MADDFADLDAVAAQGADGSLSLWHYGGADAGAWSYPGAPLADPGRANLRLPVVNVTEARVQAALSAGAWVPFRKHLSGKPLVIVKADPTGKPIPCFGPQVFGAVELAHG